MTASCLLTLSRIESETDQAAAERALEETRAVATRSGDLFDAQPVLV